MTHASLFSGIGGPEVAAYYEGKADGYMQAFDLLSESLESIEIELKK